MNVRNHTILILLFSVCLLHAEQITLQLSIPSIAVDRDERDVALFRDFDGQYYSVPGFPELPLKNFKVLLPPDADLKTVRAFLSYEHMEKVAGFWQVRSSAPRSTFSSADNLDAGVQNIQSSDGYFPASMIYPISAGQMRQHKLVDVPVSLFQYHPIHRDLRRLTAATLVVEYRRSYNAMKSDALNQDAVAERYLKDKVLNYQQFSFAYQGNFLKKSTLPRSGYVIITTGAIVSGSTNLASFVQHKNNMGYSVHLITENDWGGAAGDKAAENIRAWLQEHFLSLGIEYVLLVGNPHPIFGNVPMKMLWPRRSASSLRESPSDFYYADLNGDWDLNQDGFFGEYPQDFGEGGVDRNWDVVVGRIPVYSSCADLDHILEKIISYENAAREDCGWRRNALLPMKPLDTRVTGHLLGEQIKNKIVQPTIPWQCHRIYQDDYNLIPPPETTPCTIANVSQKWQELPFGAVFWVTNGTQDKACDVMDLVHVNQLDDSRPGFTFQCSCYNSYPENSTNLAYSLLKHGAIAAIGATRVSWYARELVNYTGSATNMGMTYEYARRLIVDEMQCGYALQDLKSTLYFWLSEDWMNIAGFNLYGDPSIGLNSYQEVVIPQYDLTITILGEGQVKTSKGTSCNDGCIMRINQGETVQLTACAASGNMFSHWSGAAVSGRGNSVTVKMNSSQSIGANFVRCQKEDHVHVAAVKFATSATSEPDLQAFEDKINSMFVERSAIDLIVTPEYSLSRTGAQDMGSPAIEFDYDEMDHIFKIASGQTQKRAVAAITAVQTLALKHRTNFVLGTVAEQAGGTIFNSQLIINHEGNIVGIRRKIGDFTPADETARNSALATVCGYTLKSQRGRCFTVLPTIGQDAVQVPEVWDALSAMNADIIALSERTGYAPYESLTQDIYNRQFDAAQDDWIPILREIFIQHYVAERNAVIATNGYLVAADGNTVAGGLLNLNDPPRPPSFLAVTNNYVYGIVELLTAMTVHYDFPESGWYMLSVPGETDDMRVTALFPDAVSGIALSYENNNYLQVQTMETGKGYWLFFAAPSQRSLQIRPIRYFKRYLKAPGWYMIGSVIDDIDFTRPLMAPSQGVRLPILSYDQTTDRYTPQNSLKSRQGYWIIDVKNCWISTEADPGLRRIVADETNQGHELIPPPHPDFTQMLFTKETPEAFRIRQNYPNPFNEQTMIAYQVAAAALVTVTVYNIRGENVRTLENAFKGSGCYQIKWDGQDENGDSVTSGVYFIHIRAGDDQQVIKTTLMK